MKHYLLAVFIFVIILCQYGWYKARKKLTFVQKKRDSHLTARLDLISLCVLLGGYILLVIHPYKLSLLLYSFSAIVIGVYLQAVYYRYLSKSAFPDAYLKAALVYFTIQYCNTIALGFIVLLLYNIV
ncbi:hypothetical protein [Aquicella lusitana]|uniref:DUF4181 domain-containing protein n=1 Tax=Aquicella lusitana TaxID=254246 RepID=A0A370GLK2_9COXI|nr:hypothetical protein [Aquicella lusitana]RDI44527.1 hypothetical protein C8D86_1099 [Aquicella lusitana]VVC72531.1 hypothetical protein AQULUS_02430 [Aquicella lusitana]